MKWFIACAFIAQLSFAQNAFANTPEIKLCYEDVTVFPWIIGDDKGLALTEIHLIEKTLKVKFILSRLPWKRCQLEAQYGNFDGIIAASFNQERTNWGIYPTNDPDGEHADNIERDFRMHTDSFYVYVRKDSNIQWNNGKFENLGKNSVGVQLGYSVGDDIVKLGYSLHSSFTDAKDILKEMDMGIVSVAVLQDHESLRILNENPSLKKNIKRLEPPFKIADQYLLLTRSFYTKNSALSKDIWHAISLARQNSDYKKQESTLLGKNH